MAEQDQNREDECPQAPASLVGALNNLQKERLFVPPALDEIVLRKARAQLRKSERPQFGRKPWVSWAAMAACLALAAWLAERFLRPPDNNSFARDDINRDGRVDILDAFVLARQIETGGTLDPRWDINRDGRIDRGDVNVIAARAVSVTAGSSTKRADNSGHPGFPPPGKASGTGRKVHCTFLLREGRTTTPSGLGEGLVPPTGKRRDCS